VLDWNLPCKFEKTEHGEKDLILYYLIYNITLSPSNVYTPLNSNM